MVFEELVEYDPVKEELKYPLERKTGADRVHPHRDGTGTARSGAVRGAQCFVSSGVGPLHAALFRPALRELCQAHRRKLRSCLVDWCVR